MKRAFLCLIVVSSLWLAYTVGSPDVFAGEKDAGPCSSRGAFVSAPSQKTWDALAKDVSSGKCGAGNTLYPALIAYLDARPHRDLPNSHTLEGITPDRFVTQQMTRIDAAFKRLRTYSTTVQLWQALKALAVQDFDEDLVITACEIAYRLSPARFDEIAAAIEKSNPSQSPIIQITRDRWSSSK